MECRYSTTKLIRLMALAAAMIAVSVICLLTPDLLARVFGGFGLAYFGVALVVLMRRLRNPEAVVTIDEEGLHDHRVEPAPIAWRDIERLEIVAIKKRRFLVMRLREGAKAPPSRGQDGGDPAARSEALAAVSFAGLEPGLDDVIEHLVAAGRLERP